MSRARESSPYGYAIEYSSSWSAVFRALAQFVRDLKGSNVIALLPDELRGLAAENNAQIDGWLAARHRLRKENLPLGASARFWVDEIESVLESARRRLTQLDPEHEASPSFASASRQLSSSSGSKSGPTAPGPRQGAGSRL